MKIRPLHDRVVIRREEQETTTAGGIILSRISLIRKLIKCIEILNNVIWVFIAF